MPILLLLWMSANLSLTSGWGSEGHRIITSIAELLLSSRNAGSLLKPLRADLLGASTWADSDEAEEKYPLSGAYHFSSTPYRKCGAFDMKRDCGYGKTKGICIVTGLSEAITMAVDPNTSESDRTDSLKFILHLMADIHQPLHTGFREDTGGLRVKLSQPDGANLHSIWDTKVIDELKASSGSLDLLEELQQRLEAREGAFLRTIRAETNFTEVLSSEKLIVDYVASLATDTATTATCLFAYMGLNSRWIGVGDALTSEYFSSRIGVATVQILKASVRLASLLDAIADTLYARRALAKMTRRDVRIEKLFERKIDTTAVHHDPLEDNPFSLLFTYFDAAIADQAFLSTIDTFSSIKDRRKSTKPRDDESLTDELLSSLAREHASYIFYGVDLNEIASKRISEITVISSKTKLKDPKYNPSGYRWAINVRDDSGNFTTHHLGFDITVYPMLNDELCIRTVLKLRGIDPRIDITDYRVSQPLSNPESIRSLKPSAILPALLVDHYKRTITKEEGTVASRIRKSSGQYLSFYYEEHRIHLFLHPVTFSMAMKNRVAFLRRFNRYLEHFKSVEYTLIVDPAIIRGPLIYTLSEGGANFQLLCDNAVQVSLPREMGDLFREIIEVELAMRARDLGGFTGYNLVGNDVDWFFDIRGDSIFSYSSLVFFHRGVSEAEIKEYLGIETNTTTRIDRLPFVHPHGFTVNETTLIYRKLMMYRPEAVSLDLEARSGYGFLYHIPEHLSEVSSFEAGSARAFFLKKTLESSLVMAQGFVKKSISDDGLITDSKIYIVDRHLLPNNTIPLDWMDLVITQLDRVGIARNQTLHPIIEQLRSIEYMISSNETDGVKAVSPHRAAVSAIGSFKSIYSKDEFLFWRKTE